MMNAEEKEHLNMSDDFTVSWLMKVLTAAFIHSSAFLFWRKLQLFSLDQKIHVAFFSNADVKIYYEYYEKYCHNLQPCDIIVDANDVLQAAFLQLLLNQWCADPHHFLKHQPFIILWKESVKAPDERLSKQISQLMRQRSQRCWCCTDDATLSATNVKKPVVFCLTFI